VTPARPVFDLVAAKMRPKAVRAFASWKTKALRLAELS